jgi:S1-C subfamily serine protease
LLSLDSEPIATVDALWRALTAARIGERVPAVIARRLVHKTIAVTPTERR